MMLGTQDTASSRLRVGILFLAIGVLLVLWSWGSWMYRASVRTDSVRTEMGSPGDGPAGRIAGESEQAARALPYALLVFLLLLIAVVCGSVIILRGIRRNRAALEREPLKPTPVEDVWAMNRLPEDKGEE